MFGLVERLWYLSGQHRINRAYDDEDDRIEERYHVAGIDVRIAHQKVVLPRRIVVDGMCWIYNDPDSIYQQLRRTRGREERNVAV